MNVSVHLSRNKNKTNTIHYNNCYAKPIIFNVITTAELHQQIDISSFKKYSWGIYDREIYSGRCGYVKLPDMKGRVTIFRNGKVISIGAPSVKKSIEQLNQVKLCLITNKIISNTKLEPKIQNIVAKLILPNKLQLNKFASKLNGAIYEPDQFAGIILKSIKSINYLIFASGKIIIAGSKSEEDLRQASFEIQQRLEKVSA